MALPALTGKRYIAASHLLRTERCFVQSTDQLRSPVEQSDFLLQPASARASVPSLPLSAPVDICFSNQSSIIPARFLHAILIYLYLRRFRLLQLYGVLCHNTALLYDLCSTPSSAALQPARMARNGSLCCQIPDSLVLPCRYLVCPAAVRTSRFAAGTGLANWDGRSLSDRCTVHKYMYIYTYIIKYTFSVHHTSHRVSRWHWQLSIRLGANGGSGL